VTPGRPTDDHLPDWYPELAQREFSLGWSRRTGTPEQWRQRGREAFREALLEPLDEVDAEPETRGVEARDGYRVERVDLTLGRFRRTPALLAVPEGPGPFPALLLLHDHGAKFTLGKEKLIRPLAGHGREAEAVAWTNEQYGGVFVGDEAARRGWVVLCTDAYGWGDRACAGYESQQALASNLSGWGSSWAGVIAAEDVAAARWLARHPLVDGDRVAALGHSLGGFRAWQVNALSEDVGAAVGAGHFGTVAGLLVPGGNRARGQSAWSLTHPGLARLLDYPDLAALAAPKPLLLLHGRRDTLFPAATVAEASQQTADVYAGFGNPDAFRSEWTEGGHAFGLDGQERAWNWLASVRFCPRNRR